MNQEVLEKALQDLPLGSIKYYEKVGSTNELAAELSEKGAPDLSLIVANEQTSGRGRSGRRWFTPPDCALAFSLLLKPSKTTIPDHLTKVTGLGALAVREGLNEIYNLGAEIKWPNDVLLEGKKVCGVLVEAHWMGDQLQALILGIGINVAPESVPPPEELIFPATCIADVVGKVVDRLEIIESVLTNLIRWRNKISQPTFMTAWNKHLAYRGERVQLLSGDAPIIEGHVVGLDESGRLILQMEDEEEKTFQSGEIHLRPFVDR
jgi:BirA family biotin operon repressor/biotin-[acetyl-CoA-carboxylase] ligase